MRVCGFFVLALLAGVGCRVDRVAPPESSDLEGGGVYVAYNLGCVEGCRDVARGDRIVAVDGRSVDTRRQLLETPLTEDRPVEVDIVRPGETTRRTVTIRARPGQKFEPLQDTPPFWTVSAAALDRAPQWARSPMFSHALPAFGFVHVNGGWVTGRDLYGRRTMIVVWPDLPMFEKQYWNFRDAMATFYGVLQRAQHDLQMHGVHIVLAICGGANDTTVRRELETMGQVDEAGEPLPPLPVYRCPSMQSGGWAPTAGSQVQAFGNSPARHLGLEHSGQSFFHYVRGFPALVVVDEGGIVRWHSSGYHDGPQNTILGAVLFAMHELDEPREDRLADAR
jgi:hypothetical protein